MKPGSKIFVLISRIFLGGVLIYASIDKIINPLDFAKAIDNYQIIPFGLENIMAIIIPWLELTIGIFLIFGILLHGASLLVILLMICFIIGMSIAILKGYNIECGCGLISGEMVGLHKIVEDIIYLVLALIILKRQEQKIKLLVTST